jgi:hypothetical protein
MEVQETCIRQCTSSKSTQTDLGTLDAPRSGTTCRKGATESVDLEILMEGLGTHIAASLRRNLACEFFSAF